MKNYIVLFLIMTALTGLIGFIGWNFYGISAVRILFLIFADLLVVSLVSKIFFSNPNNLILQRVKK